MANRNDNKIDIVVPWVDGEDIAWRIQKNEWAAKEAVVSVADDSDVRFRNWDIIKYLFRSIEKNMSWINKVHFVTWGHLPQWMNQSCEKLHIVNHKDFIPAEYLPTFSSHTIELNMHRIPGLAEKFIYFNDDIVVLQSTKLTDFFRNNLPCDYGIHVPLISYHRYSVQDTGLTNVEIINDHFKKKDVIKNNVSKWFNFRYGINNFRTLLMMPYSRFSSFYGNHLCNSFLRSSFERIWEEEADVLNSTCLHKFRTRRDVNQWIIRYWQLATGEFAPISPNRGKYYVIKENNDSLIDCIRRKSCKVICINDTGEENIKDVDKCRDEIIHVLDEVFYQKSEFEI